MVKRIVVTGASSYLGRNVVQGLLAKENCDVEALISPRSADLQIEGGSRVRATRADLCRELTTDVMDILRGADRVFHLAWVRKGRPRDVQAANEAMINNLLSAVRTPDRLYFMSSVAASPTAFSGYGMAKWSAQQIVLKEGGIVLVCGLVVEPVPHGPYHLLCRAVRSLPVAIRMTTGSLRVYPVHIDDVVACIGDAIESDRPSGTYRLFASVPPDFNDFMQAIERQYPKARIPFGLDPLGLTRWMTALSRVRLIPAAWIDKILTFLNKNQVYLDSIREWPGTLIRPWSDALLVAPRRSSPTP